MAEPQQLDLRAERNLYFAQPLVFIGEDFAGATALEMQIRRTPDALGAAYISLHQVTDNSEGVWLQYSGTDTMANHVAAGHVDAEIYGTKNPLTGQLFQPTDNVVLSLLRIYLLVDSRIPFLEERGPDTVAAYDLILTPAGAPGRKLAFGKFIVRGTATYF